MPLPGSGGVAIGTDGLVWQNWRGAHEILSFDRRKCKVLNGPNATGQQCAEGWTVYKKEGPAFDGAPDDFRTDMLYLTEVDRENALGLGKDVVLAGDVNADSFFVVMPQTGQTLTLRVPYPLGFHSRHVSGRIDDEKACWKGRGFWSSFAGAAMTPPRADCCIPAPPVLELDQDGKLLASWGGPGQGYEWPSTEHGIFVDAKDNVWLAGNGDKDAQVLKFTTQGKFLAQFGYQGKSGGSSDTQNLGGPANLTVDSANNELYVADGYKNHRVIVIDTERLTFKRMWGAYGNKPDDKDLGPYNPDSPPVQQFRLPHNVALSKDGFVYVADRPDDRIQVFKRDGTFVREGFIAPRTLLAGSASGLAFSPDQRFLYVIDGANHHVWILLRDTLQVVDHIGQQGIFGGSLNVPHALAVDSKGNIYVGENFDGRRFQRFVYKGMGAPTGNTLPPPKP